MRLFTVILLSGLAAGEARSQEYVRVHDSLDAGFAQSEEVLLSAYRRALESLEIRRVSLDALRSQVKQNVPLAVVDGFWVTPIDLWSLFTVPLINEQIRDELLRDDAAEAKALLEDPRHFRRVTALAFTSNDLNEFLGIPFVGDFEVDLV